MFKYIERQPWLLCALSFCVLFISFKNCSSSFFFFSLCFPCFTLVVIGVCVFIICVVFGWHCCCHCRFFSISCLLACLVSGSFRKTLFSLKFPFQVFIELQGDIIQEVAGSYQLMSIVHVKKIFIFAYFVSIINFAFLNPNMYVMYP